MNLEEERLCNDIMWRDDIHNRKVNRIFVDCLPNALHVESVNILPKWQTCCSSAKSSKILENKSMSKMEMAKSNVNTL